MTQLLSSMSGVSITPFQVRGARAILDLGVRDLAKAAEVSTATVTRFERENGGINMQSLSKIATALEAAGVTFLPDTGYGPGVAFKPKETTDA